MKRLLTACLLWISVCAGWQCASPLPAAGLAHRPTRAEDPPPVFSRQSASMLFKAHFQYGKKLQIGGLLMLKQTQPNVYRVLLMAEMGATLFDFEFGEGHFKVHRSLEALNKPMLLKIIEKDIKLLLMQNPFEGRARQWTDSRNGRQYYKIKHRGVPHVYAQQAPNQWLFFQEGRAFRIDMSDYDADKGIPKNIVLQHYLFPLRLELQFIK